MPKSQILGPIPPIEKKFCKKNPLVLIHHKPLKKTIGNKISSIFAFSTLPSGYPRFRQMLRQNSLGKIRQTVFDPFPRSSTYFVHFWPNILHTNQDCQFCPY